VEDFTLAAYRDLLETGLASGYRFIGFDRATREDAPLSCLLRHDLDTELLGCLPMANLEAETGVSATYFVMLRSTAYNALCLEALRVMDRVLGRGHHLGLHFMAEPWDGEGPTTIAQRVAHEAAILEREVGRRISAVSFHQPSAHILAAQLVLGSLINTYNAAQLPGYVYVSDSNMRWRGDHPRSIFSRRSHPRLQLLIHPMWWTDQPTSVEDKWRIVLRTNRSVLLEHWSAREVTLSDGRAAHLDATDR
jgi:hypothetical protein